MKTKITLLIAIVAVLTLSFTFAGIQEPMKSIEPQNSSSMSVSEPIGGLFVDEVVE